MSVEIPWGIGRTTQPWLHPYCRRVVAAKRSHCHQATAILVFEKSARSSAAAPSEPCNMDN